MVKLGQSDERIFGELREALEQFLRQLTPVTERFAPLDVILRKLLASKMGSSQVAVQVAVMGRRKSGKSTFVNALVGGRALPVRTIDVLKLIPGKEREPVLRTPKGKTVAAGFPGIHEYITDERIETNRLPELMTRQLHARVLDSGEFYAAVWEVSDTTPETTAVCPKLSSVASRIFAPNEFYADVIYYCVDARLLGTTAEGIIFDNLITLDEEERVREGLEPPPDALLPEEDLTDPADRDAYKPRPKGSSDVTPIATRRRLLECTVFVLTHMDTIANHEEGFTDIHAKHPPAMKTVQHAFDRFCELVEDAFEEEIAAERVLVLNGTGAWMAKNIQKRHSTSTMAMDAQTAPMPHTMPTVHELYEYSETFFGSAFMQNVDSMPLEELQRLVIHHSWSQGLGKSGALALDQTIAIMDFNIARHLMTSVAVAGSESADTLLGALNHGLQTLSSERQSARTQVELLEAELTWAHESIEVIQTSVSKGLGLINSTAETVVDRFFKRRLEELQYVIEHKGLEWFMSRQTGVVVDMKSALTRFEDFSTKYLQHRRYLLDKLTHKPGDSHDAFDDPLLNDDPALKPFAASTFLAQHMDDVLGGLERDKHQHLLPLFTCFAHHLRDEVLHAMEDFKTEINEARMQALDHFVRACERPVAETMSRVSKRLDVNAILEPIMDLELIAENGRRLNNLLRELPEHVAGAAVSISNDEYQRVRAEEEARADAANVDDDGDEAGVDRIGIDKALTKLRVNATGLPEPGSTEMEKHLRYITEGWRIALATVSVEQLSTFRIDDFSDVMASCSAEVVSFISEYAQSIRDGLEEHRDLVAKIDSDIEEAQQKLDVIPPFLDKFNRIRRALSDVNATDNADVHHVQLVERQHRGLRRRSFDGAMALPRRRASLVKGLSQTKTHSFGPAGGRM